MITEQEAQELVTKYKRLKKSAESDESVKLELKKHESICISKLKYLVTMKVGKYKNFNNYEDLIQEGYEALLKGIKTYESSKGSVFWWLHKYIDTRISRSANLHTTIRYPLKVAKQQAPYKEFNMPNLIEEIDCPDKKLEEHQSIQLINNNLKYLSEKQKEILSLAFGFNDKICSINKIAKKTNLSRSAVLKEYKAALNTLKEHIKQ